MSPSGSGLHQPVALSSDPCDCPLPWLLLRSKGSAFNMQMGKQSFYDILEETSLEDKYETAGAYMADYFYSADGQEGLQAHYEKRRGVWAHT